MSRNLLRVPEQDPESQHLKRFAPHAQEGCGIGSSDASILLVGYGLKLVAIAIILYALYLLWTSDFWLVAKIVLTPITSLVLAFLYNTIVALPLITLWEWRQQNK